MSRTGRLVSVPLQAQAQARFHSFGISSSYLDVTHSLLNPRRGQQRTRRRRPYQRDYCLPINFRRAI